MKIIVIGGGAAGFFGAITCAQTFSNAQVTLLEKSPKLLAKVKISGGGRCNVTHACYERSRLVKQYPRGEKALVQPFAQFDATDTVQWFEKRGVQLRTELDGRMFPVTDDSQSIINCLVQEAHKAKVTIRTQTGVHSIQAHGDNAGFTVKLLSGEVLEANRVLVATGGNPSPIAYNWLVALGHQIEPPVPSLFTFNVPNSYLLDLPGVSVPQATVKVAGTKLQQTGPVLFTHWGFSGPAILKLSAWGARALADVQYQFTLLINWLPQFNEDQLRNELLQYREANSRKLVAGHALFDFPQRLWNRWTERAAIPAPTRWGDLPKKNLNRFIDLLTRSEFEVTGKSTFKDEFVTCGGIASQDINWQTMESKRCPGLFFAGEVIDVDGITGGFNFQAAWTTGYIAGCHIGK